MRRRTGTKRASGAKQTIDETTDSNLLKTTDQDRDAEFAELTSDVEKLEREAELRSREYVARKASVEAWLGKQLTGGLKKFRKEAVSDPRRAMRDRCCEILAMQLFKAYEGSAAHAKLCLEWGEAGAEREAQSKPGMSEVLLRRMGIEVPEGLRSGSAETTETR